MSRREIYIVLKWPTGLIAKIPLEKLKTYDYDAFGITVGYRDEKL